MPAMANGKMDLNNGDLQTIWTTAMVNDLRKCRDHAKSRDASLTQSGIAGSFQQLLDEEWKKLYPQSLLSEKALNRKLQALEHPRKIKCRRKPHMMSSTGSAESNFDCKEHQTKWTNEMVSDLQKCGDHAKSRHASLNQLGIVGSFQQLLAEEWKTLYPQCLLSGKILMSKLYILEHPPKFKFKRKPKVQKITQSSTESGLNCKEHQTKWTKEMLSDLQACRDKARSRHALIRKTGKRVSFQGLLADEWRKLYPQYPHTGNNLTTRLYVLEHAKPTGKVKVKPSSIGSEQSDNSLQLAAGAEPEKNDTEPITHSIHPSNGSADDFLSVSEPKQKNYSIFDSSGSERDMGNTVVSLSATAPMVILNDFESCAEGNKLISGRVRPLAKIPNTTVRNLNDNCLSSDNNKTSTPADWPATSSKVLPADDMETNSSATTASVNSSYSNIPANRGKSNPMKTQNERNMNNSAPIKKEMQSEDRKTTWTRQMLNDLVMCRDRAKAEQASMKESGQRMSYQNILADSWKRLYPEFNHDRGLLVARLYNLEHPRQKKRSLENSQEQDKKGSPANEAASTAIKKWTPGSDSNGIDTTPRTASSTPTPLAFDADLGRGLTECDPDSPLTATDTHVKPGRMTPHERNMTSEISRKWRPITGIALSPSKGLPDIQVKLQDVNPLLTCGLCRGYLISATTITDCLHSFCKSCIVRHVEMVSVNCPSCGNIIHPSNPYQSMRLDCTMQDIIYKLLPHIEVEEKRREKEFYISRGLQYPPPKPQNEPTPPPAKRKKMRTSASRSASPAPIEFVSIHLEHAGSAKGTGALRVLTKNYIRVMSQATVGHLQRLLDSKLNANHLGQLSLFVDSYLLHSSLTLHDVKELFFEDNEELMTIQYGIMPLRDFFDMDTKIVEPSSDEEYDEEEMEEEEDDMLNGMDNVALPS